MKITIQVRLGPCIDGLIYGLMEPPRQSIRTQTLEEACMVPPTRFARDLTDLLRYGHGPGQYCP